MAAGSVPHPHHTTADAAINPALTDDGMCAGWSESDVAAILAWFASMNED